MAKPFHSSASQIDTYEMCPRKWALDKIDKLPRKPNKYAAMGSALHKIAEEWLRDGIPAPATELGEIIMPLIPHLPPPNTPGLEIETTVKRTLAGVAFKGLIDVRLPYPYSPIPKVWDHKSTTDLKWALTPEGLVTNVQSTLYAWDTILDSQERGYKGDVVDLQWGYMRTRGAPKALPVCQRVSMADILPRLEKTKKAALEQKLLRETISSGLELPPSADACEAYGGCPYAETCNLTASQRIRSIMGQGNAHNAFMQKLAKRREEAGQAPAEPHPAPAEAPTSVPAKSGTVNPPEAPAEAPAAPEEAPAPPPKPSGKGKKVGKKKAKTKAKTKAAPPAAAPEAPAPPPAPVAAPQPAPVAPQPAIMAPVATDPMALVTGLLEAAKDGRAIVVMVIPNGQSK